MQRFSRVSASRLFAAALCAGLSIPSLAQVSVRSVKVLGSKDTVEIEIEASDRIIPQTQMLTGPDRLVVDFPNSLPSGQLRNQSVDRGEVKDVRVGLFQSKPPVTRVVLDLKSAGSCQVFPNGRTVMIKVTGDGANAGTSGFDRYAIPAGSPGLVAANYTTSAERVSVAPSQQTPLQVSYRNGLLGIHANKATLSEVLFAISQRTGADIAIPAGAEQEKVVAEIEPAPAPEVLAKLLNGSRFNFLILSAPNDSRGLDRVILSVRTEGNFVPALPNEQPLAEEESAPTRAPATTLAAAPAPSAPRPGADFDTPDEVQEK